jgi:hypothetical protein
MCIHYQNQRVCRVSSRVPSVFHLAFGKHALCPVFQKNTRQKTETRRISSLKNANEVWRTRNLAWCHYMISIGCGNFFQRFQRSCDIQFLEIEPSPRKNQYFERECVTLEEKATVASSFDLETFYTLNIHH